MNRFLQHPLALPVAVLVALAAVLALARFTGVESAGSLAAPQVGRAPLGRTTVVCPEPSVSRVTTATSLGGGSGTGSAQIRTIGAPDSRSRRELGVLDRRGVVHTTKLGGDAPAVVVHAEGAMAGGLEVEQTSNTGEGPGQGLSATRCTRPATSFWFVGDATALGRSTTLYLTNVDDQPVSVSVDVYGPDGPIAAPAGSGLTLDPHSRRSVRLGALAPKSRIAALHVRTNGGRVGAAVHTRARRGDRGLGTDWIPRTEEPRKELVVPGVPAGNGPRRLFLAVPGNRSAKVELALVTNKGTYQPKGKDVVRVSAGSVASINLAGALSQRAAAIHVRSNVPVTAGAAVNLEDEIAYLSAVPPIAGNAVVSDNGPGEDVVSTLMLSAPLHEAAVRVTVLGPKGAVRQPEVVEIPASRTVTATLEEPAKVSGNFAVVVSTVEGSGPVYGARVLKEDMADQMSLTVLPLQTSRAHPQRTCPPKLRWTTRSWADWILTNEQRCRPPVGRCSWWPGPVRARHAR